ncbi:MAG TPA: hypothetical protein VHT04_07280 [Stellaceae bacterium]|nr:hypothetical protein [Stellaceae bacterium]
MRFWNDEVNENIEGVLSVIAGACGIDLDGNQPALCRQPHPDPLRKGEGEGTTTLERPRRMLSRGYAPRRRG